MVMSPECSTWEVGDAFDEEVEIVARVSWPSDFMLPYCAAKPVPSRDSVPEEVSYNWCTDEGEPLPIPAVVDLIEDPEAQLPEPSERYLRELRNSIWLRVTTKTIHVLGEFRKR